jgi:hypothetical protein
MSGAPELQEIAFEPDGVEALLARVPQRAGVAQLLDEARESLLIAQPAGLRRWVAAQLGMAPPPRKPARRPRVDLRPVARALRFRTTSYAFEQRLTYERLMAAHVPLAKRRDLRAPGWLRLDLGLRFPRIEAAGLASDGTTLFGPFRDRKAAARARDLLHREIPLRPCDYSFEPDPALPLGLGCLYAQMRSCAAPCLSRVSPGEYRALAQSVADRLAADQEPPLPAWRPPWLSRAAGDRAVVAERGRKGIALFPVRDGAVLDEASAIVPLDLPDEPVAALAWPAPPPGRNDWAWLSAWLHAPRRKGVCVVLREGDTASRLAERLRAALGKSAQPRPLP